MTGLTERDLCAPAAKGDTCPRVFDKVRARRSFDKVRDGIRTARRWLGNADRRPLSLAA